MATFTRPDIFSKYLCDKVFDLDTDVVRWVLSNTAPVLGSTNLLSNVVQIATGGGWTQMTDGAGGFLATLTTPTTQTGQGTNIGQTGNVGWTATAGGIATFRYLILIDDTPASPLNPVIGWLDHGVPVTMAVTDTYTIPGGNLLLVG